MSHTFAAAPSKSAIKSLLAAAGAQLSGKTRGPDQGGGRRVPRRHSYEETDPRAKPWSKVGDGSQLQGIVHCEVLISTADALRRQLRKEFPLTEIRCRRAERANAAAELDELLARSAVHHQSRQPASDQIRPTPYGAVTRPGGRGGRGPIRTLSWHRGRTCTVPACSTVRRTRHPPAA